MTPRENVRPTSKKAVMPFLERLDLTIEDAKRNVLKLSGGQQHGWPSRWRWPARSPTILADESTGNLDEDKARVSQFSKKAPGS